MMCRAVLTLLDGVVDDHVGLASQGRVDAHLRVLQGSGGGSTRGILPPRLNQVPAGNLDHVIVPVTEIPA